MQILVSDHFETYKKCPKAYYYKYIQGLKIFQPKEKFSLGKNIHALASYKAKNLDITKLLDALTFEEKMHFENLLSNDFFNYPQIASEWGFDVYLDGDFWLNGRIDAVFEKDDKVIIVDWKTGENLPLNPEESYQAMIYLYAFYHSKKDFGMNFLASSLEFWFVETKKPKSVRIIKLNDKKMKEIEQKLVQTAHKMTKDVVFECNKNGCKFCDYLEICS